MNLKLVKKSIEYSTDVVNIVKEYSIVMDKYFEKEENQEEHKELYLAYEHFTKQLQEKAKIRGLV